MPLLLYSTNTWLAFHVNEEHYGGVHWVWCSEYFSDFTRAPALGAMPPSSSPSEIYRTLLRDIRGGDQDSSKILKNRKGILWGAEQMKKKERISEQDFKDISDKMRGAPLQDFRPLLYVIPVSGLGVAVTELPVAERANPTFREYIIEELPRGAFDLITFQEA